nr:hypothetical protein [Tanacetum cinerariifolium]
ERVRKESYRQGPKAKEKSSKALMAIDGIGWDWSYMANEEDHALVADGEIPTEFALMANNENKDEKDLVDGKLARLLNSSKDLEDIIESQRRRVQREINRYQNHSYKSSTLRSSGPRRHGNSMRPPFRPAGHRPHGPSMNPRRPTMNGARPYKTFFQTPSFETRSFLNSSAVNNSYRAPWVSTSNRYIPPVNRKFSTGRRKFTTGSTKNHTADMGRKGKAVKPSACWTW